MKKGKIPKPIIIEFYISAINEDLNKLKMYQYFEAIICALKQYNKNLIPESENALAEGAGRKSKQLSFIQ